MRELPKDSVRGRIKSWIERHADQLGDDVLEIGGRIHDQKDAWFLNNRHFAAGNWTVVDMQEGENVDYAMDITSALECAEFSREYGLFSGVVCSEVLEHCRKPWEAIRMMENMIEPGGLIVITVPFGFHRHAYPNDYFRFTDEGLKSMLDDAGFTDYQFEYAGETILNIKNDDGPEFQKKLEMQLFATAVKR